MKYIITEDQLEKVKDKILKIHFEVFDNDWDVLQKYLSRRGNPPYIIVGDLDLSKQKNLSLSSLIAVEGDLKLPYTMDFDTFDKLLEVEGSLTLSYTLIKSLGSLRKVGGDLDLSQTSIQSLGDLEYVGGYLYLKWCQELKSLGNLLEVDYSIIMDNSSVESLGNLKQVGGNLSMGSTPISERLQSISVRQLEKEIRQDINVDGNIHFR